MENLFIKELMVLDQVHAKHANASSLLFDMSAEPAAAGRQLARVLAVHNARAGAGLAAKSLVNPAMSEKKRLTCTEDERGELTW